MSNLEDDVGDEVTQESDTPLTPEVAQGGKPLGFNPWLTCSHPAAQALTDNLVAFNEAHHIATLSRRPKAEHQANFAAITRTIIANLAYATVTEHNPHGAVAVSLRAGRRAMTRYDRKGFSSLPEVIMRLEEAGLFTLHRSLRKGQASTLTPTSRLKETLGRFRWSGDEFGEELGGETILLTRTERDSRGDIRLRERIDYADNPTADLFRAEMATINSALAAADLTFEPDGGPLVQPRRRMLARHFKLIGEFEGEPAFNLGGRLFGAWYQNLAKTRRRNIRLAGSPVVELDFQGMALRLALIKAGLPQPPGDPYAVDALGGLSETRWRPGLKLALLALLSRTSPLQRLPKGAVELLPKGMTGPSLRAAIFGAYPELAAAGVFERGLALELQFQESQIMVAALLQLTRSGIPALPLHDGLLAPQSKADIAAAAMKAAAIRVVGQPLPVVQKAVVY